VEQLAAAAAAAAASSSSSAAAAAAQAQAAAQVPISVRVFHVESQNPRSELYFITGPQPASMTFGQLLGLVQASDAQADKRWRSALMLLRRPGLPFTTLQLPDGAFTLRELQQQVSAHSRSSGSSSGTMLAFEG
jgi:hypothetical protein